MGRALSGTFAKAAVAAVGTAMLPAGAARRDSRSTGAFAFQMRHGRPRGMTRCIWTAAAVVVVVAGGHCASTARRGSCSDEGIAAAEAAGAGGGECRGRRDWS
jgi:hypothetical protein